MLLPDYSSFLKSLRISLCMLCGICTSPCHTDHTWTTQCIIYHSLILDRCVMYVCWDEYRQMRCIFFPSLSSPFPLSFPPPQLPYPTSSGGWDCRLSSTDISQSSKGVSAQLLKTSCTLEQWPFRDFCTTCLGPFHYLILHNVPRSFHYLILHHMPRSFSLCHSAPHA